MHSTIFALLSHACTWQALAELSEAGLSEEKVEVLWDLYSEARQAQEDRSGAGGAAGAQGGVQPAGPTQATQGSGRVGMFALGVLSRLLTVLRLLYSVRVSLMLCRECRPRCHA